MSAAYKKGRLLYLRKKKMASSVSSSHSSAFLAMPLEIRRQIYRYCIPQKPLIDVSSGVCRKNRFDWSEELNEHYY